MLNPLLIMMLWLTAAILSYKFVLQLIVTRTERAESNCSDYENLSHDEDGFTPLSRDEDGGPPPSPPTVSKKRVKRHAPEESVGDATAAKAVPWSGENSGPQRRKRILSVKDERAAATGSR